VKDRKWRYFDPDRLQINLKQIMDSLEMNQNDLAERSGITRAAVCQILSGKRMPNLDTVCKILTVLPVTFERLVR